MKQKILFLSLVLAFGFASQLFAESKNFSGKRSDRAVSIEASLKTLTVGERLVFDVFWMGIPIGLGSLEVKEKINVRGRQAFHVIAIAQTNEFLSKIYPVHDEVHSFIDAEAFHSLEFRKNLKEGKYRADEKVIYDYQKKKVLYESLLNKSKKEFELVEGVHDFLSAFYWFRLQEINAQRKLHTIVNSEEQNWDLELNVLGREIKELKGDQAIDTVVVEPKTQLKGALYNRGRVWVYFSVDKRRKPVWVVIRTPFGPVSGVLKTEGFSS